MVNFFYIFGIRLGLKNQRSQKGNILWRRVSQKMRWDFTENGKGSKTLISVSGWPVLEFIAVKAIHQPEGVDDVLDIVYLDMHI